MHVRGWCPGMYCKAWSGLVGWEILRKGPWLDGSGTLPIAKSSDGYGSRGGGAAEFESRGHGAFGPAVQS